MKNSYESIDKIVKMWYNKSVKGTNALQEVLEFARFANHIFVDAEDREYAFDKFESLIKESLNE